MENKIEEKQNFKKEPKNELIIFDRDLNIIELVSLSNIYKDNNEYPNNKFYIEAELDLFFELKKLLKTNTLKLTKNPIEEEITIQDIKCTPLPPKPPTSEEVIKKALSNQENDIKEINKKIEEFTVEFLQLSEIQRKIEDKLNVLSDIVIKLATKGNV